MFLRSIDGKFYQIPDDQAAQYLIPADKVAEALRKLCGDARGQVQAYHMLPPPPFGPSGPLGPPGPPMPFGPPPAPPIYFNYYNYRNFWGGW